MVWRKLDATERHDTDSDAVRAFGAYAPNARQRTLIRIGQATVLQRGKLRKVWTRLVQAQGMGKLDVRFRGAAYRLHGDRNLIECGLLLRPDYNGTDIDFLIEGAAADAGFVDIGSNIGLYSLPMALTAPRGTTLAIDANPKMVARLRWNAQATGVSNVNVVHAAVSDRLGSCDLSIRKDDLAIVAIDESAGGSIPMFTLLELVQRAGLTRIHGLKIDIEGHEDKALVPFLNDAPPALHPRRIVIERATRTHDYPGCVAVFERLGYKLVTRTTNNSLYRLDRA